MLFSVSIVNVAILLLLLAACCGHHIDHSVQRRKNALSIEEIEILMRADGYETRSKDFPAYLRQLLRESKQFVEVTPGRWSMQTGQGTSSRSFELKESTFLSAPGTPSTYPLLQFRVDLRSPEACATTDSVKPVRTRRYAYASLMTTKRKRRRLSARASVPQNTTADGTRID
jgi:hypothetical protein